MDGPPGGKAEVDNGVLAVVGAIAVVALTALLFFIRSKAPTPVPAAINGGDNTDVGASKKTKKKDKKGRLGMARLRNMQRAAQEGEDDVDGINFQAMDGDEDDDDDNRPAKKMGAKKLAKEEAKREKAAAREAMQADREDAKRREELRRQEADAERAKEEEEERQKEEEEKKAIEEQKRKEEEEYQAMKAMFSVEEAGSVADEIAVESQSLLSELISYVKETKIVQLEQLASKFNLKTRDAIMRLEALEKMGQISGVMTDNGKYIYITDDEMKSVVKFMRQRGRVSIQELSENSHKLISLEGTVAS